MTGYRNNGGRQVPTHRPEPRFYPTLPPLRVQLAEQITEERQRQAGWVERPERSNMLLMPANWWGPKE